VFGCELNLITIPARVKFCRLFGVDLAITDENGMPRTNINVFREQALCGERGIAFEVAACTNHCEGAHGRLNARVDGLRSLKVRFAEIMSAIVASAATWSQKVERGWHAAKKKLEESAQKSQLKLQDCPEGAHCEKGLVLSRRLGRPVPCVHVISMHGWPEHALPTQFNLCRTGAPDVSFTEFSRLGVAEHSYDRFGISS
jgi:hypothetical protein